MPPALPGTWRGREDDELVVALADKIISVAIGANVMSLMYPVEVIVSMYTDYIDLFISRIVEV